MRRARAFWVEAPGVGAIREEPLRQPEPDEVLVRALASGVSAGTERLVFEGRIPTTEHARMRAPLQAGDFPAPVKYGYASVGIVEVGPTALVGTPVFCLHPHQDLFVAPAALVAPLPASVPSARAVLAANMETALNASWDAEPPADARIAVVGLGVVGLLTGHVLQRQGHAPLMIDVDDARVAQARELGLEAGGPEAAGPFDLVIHASGRAEGLLWALERMAFEGRILELSWYGDQPVSLPLGGAFHSQRLTLQSSQVGAVAAPMRSRTTHRQRLEQALALLDDARLDALIDTSVPLDALPLFMAELAAGRRRVLCAKITYGDQDR